MNGSQRFIVIEIISNDVSGCQLREICLVVSRHYSKRLPNSKQKGVLQARSNVAPSASRRLVMELPNCASAPSSSPQAAKAACSRSSSSCWVTMRAVCGASFASISATSACFN